MAIQKETNFSQSLRLVVAALGGYAFAAGLVAIIAIVLPSFGMPASESAMLGGLLGILIYLSIIIWVVSSSKPVCTAIIIFLSAASMLLLSTLIAAAS